MNCAARPTIPLFPVSVATLMEFAVWASQNGITSWDSIANYVGDVVTWAVETTNQLDPRSATPQDAKLWGKFVRNFPAVVGGNPSAAKLRLQPGHVAAMILDMVDSSWIDRRDHAAYLVLWYSSCRIGHVAPAAATVEALGHTLRWSSLRFVPSVLDADHVFIFFPSTKTRPMAANRPWYTAIGAVTDPDLCAVTQLRRHFLENYTGRPDDFVFTRDLGDGRHYTRTSFTDILRFRLVAGAHRHLGIRLTASSFSGISWRKGSLQTAAEQGTPGYVLANLADHATIDTTRQHYLADTVEGRAAHTAAIGSGFVGVSPRSVAPRLAAAADVFAVPPRYGLATPRR